MDPRRWNPDLIAFPMFLLLKNHKLERYEAPLAARVHCGIGSHFAPGRHKLRPPELSPGRPAGYLSDTLRRACRYAVLDPEFSYGPTIRMLEQNW